MINYKIIYLLNEFNLFLILGNIQIFLKLNYYYIINLLRLYHY